MTVTESLLSLRQLVQARRVGRRHHKQLMECEMADVFGLKATSAVLVLVFSALHGLSAFAQGSVTNLSQDDFKYGTYIIDRPGVYRLTENISFNPNAKHVLQADVDTGLSGLPNPVRASDSSMPLHTQFQFGPGAAFEPGGPLDARYDPSAYGIGFFAAIAIQADGVELDLNGFTLEQSAEHALMQRFFAVIELANQPFIPSQGPADFGSRITAAHNVTIHGGTIGRSAHHGIHGNANVNVTVSNVQFDGYEVAAIALNGVEGLEVKKVKATNRKDVPILGTFSSAVFIKPYVDDLVRAGTTETLTVAGVTLTAGEIQSELHNLINDIHEDIIEVEHEVDGRAAIDSELHPEAYALCHNPHGLVDGNSYSFLLNNLGVAVHGFPNTPDGVTQLPSKNIVFKDVHVRDQQAFINEVPALSVEGAPTVDPVGAVFQVMNVHPDTGAPITISSTSPDKAVYLGNPVANAQVLVAKAAAAGDVGSGRLDISRMNISSDVIDWVESQNDVSTLADIEATWLCNGDSMFHVNKGVIGFKMDAAQGVKLRRTSVTRLENLGEPGVAICGDYTQGQSHPKATLSGYGGNFARAYTFAGSTDVQVRHARARRISSASGPSIGFAVMTDSTGVSFRNVSSVRIQAGDALSATTGVPNHEAYAAGFEIATDATDVSLERGCVANIDGFDETYPVIDDSSLADAEVFARQRCPRRGSVQPSTNRGAGNEPSNGAVAIGPSGQSRPNRPGRGS